MAYDERAAVLVSFRTSQHYICTSYHYKLICNAPPNALRSCGTAIAVLTDKGPSGFCPWCLCYVPDYMRDRSLREDRLQISAMPDSDIGIAVLRFLHILFPGRVTITA